MLQNYRETYLEKKSFLFKLAFPGNVAISHPSTPFQFIWRSVSNLVSVWWWGASDRCSILFFVLKTGSVVAQADLELAMWYMTLNHWFSNTQIWHSGILDKSPHVCVIFCSMWIYMLGKPLSYEDTSSSLQELKTLASCDLYLIKLKPGLHL